LLILKIGCRNYVLLILLIINLQVEIADEVERGLFLIGATAVEDKL
jgi:hypothetical protein